MKRPISVTLALVLVLMLASWNALRAWTALAWQDILTEFTVSLPPIASAVIGIFWLLVGTTIAWAVWRNKAWSVRLLIGAAAGYTVWHWSERLVWHEPRPNLWFSVLLNIICLIVIYFASKSLSREAYERNIENPATE